MMKNISLIFVITLLFFILFNLFIVLAWPIYSNLNSNKHNYIDKQKQLLNLSEKELITLHNETWKNYDKFRFVPFIGHTETNLVGKFVNFTEENGRKVVRPKTCDTNIYLYGGSTTFGYNVTDNQTIASYLQEMLGKISNLNWSGGTSRPRYFQMFLTFKISRHLLSSRSDGLLRNMRGVKTKTRFL